MKCKDCSSCHYLPTINKHQCWGFKEPFYIRDIDAKCSEYVDECWNAKKAKKSKSKPCITLTTCESGDYEILQTDLSGGACWSGHGITNHDWIELLEILGYEVEHVEISDGEMEELCQ